MDLEGVLRRRRGAQIGAAAFLTGFVLTAVLDARKLTPDTELLRYRDGQRVETVTLSDAVWEHTSDSPRRLHEPDWLDFIAVLYHDAHFVRVTSTVTRRTSEDSAEVAASVVLEPSVSMYLLPVLLLSGAGFWLAKRFPAETPVAAAKTGAHAVFGYLPFAVLSAFFGSWSRFYKGDEMAVQLGMVTTILFMGLAYPLLLGGFGGYLQYRLDAEASDAAADSTA